jgi:hypothetical protein
VVARFYFPCVPWLVGKYRAEIRTARIKLHGALFASRHLAKVRGRHHEQLQQDMFNWIRIGPLNKITDAFYESSVVVIMGMTLFVTPVVAVAELADAPMSRLGLAVALLLGAWLVPALVLVPIMTVTGFRARLLALVAAIAVAAVVVGVFDRGRWPSWVVPAGVLGISWFSVALLIGVDKDQKDAETGRERAAMLFLPLFLFAPFLTARLLMGPDHPIWDVVLVGLLSLTVAGVVGLLVYKSVTFVGSTGARTFYATPLLILTALLVPITLVPRDPNWAVCAVRGGLLAVAGGMLAFVLLSLVYFALTTVNGRWGVGKDPEANIVRALVFQVLDLEFGAPHWWTLVVPEGADERAGKRWVRRTLASRGRAVRGMDREQMQRLTERQDGLIFTFDRHFASRYRVWHEETNEFVRKQAHQMAATMALWQRRMLIRGDEPAETLISPIVRCLDAAVSRQWDRFDRAEVDATPRRLRRRFLTGAKQVLVAVLPLVAVVILALTPARVPDALIGSLATFALTWLAANLLRAIDPRASESLDVADKLGRAARGQ